MNNPYFGHGMNSSCIGNGLPPYPPPMPPYQMCDPTTFWMYRQSFGMHPCHVTAHMSSSYPHFGCSFPYAPHPGSYFSAYFSERCNNQYPDISRLGCYFGNASRRDDSVVNETSNAAGNNIKEDGAGTQQAYSNASNHSRNENTILIESVYSTAENSSRVHNHTEKEKEDDERSVDSHSLVIVDDKPDEEKS